MAQVGSSAEAQAHASYERADYQERIVQVDHSPCGSASLGQGSQRNLQAAGQGHAGRRAFEPHAKHVPRDRQAGGGVGNGRRNRGAYRGQKMEPRSDGPPGNRAPKNAVLHVGAAGENPRPASGARMGADPVRPARVVGPQDFRGAGAGQDRSRRGTGEGTGQPGGGR